LAFEPDLDEAHAAHTDRLHARVVAKNGDFEAKAFDGFDYQFALGDFEFDIVDRDGDGIGGSGRRGGHAGFSLHGRITLGWCSAFGSPLGSASTLVPLFRAADSRLRSSIAQVSTPRALRADRGVKPHAVKAPSSRRSA